MNKKIFLATTLIIALVLLACVWVRMGLDEVSTPSPFLRSIDAGAGSLLSVGCFFITCVVLIFGSDPPIRPSYTVLFLFVGIIASSAIWGILVERAIHILRKRSRTT